MYIYGVIDHLYQKIVRFSIRSIRLSTVHKVTHDRLVQGTWPVTMKIQCTLKLNLIMVVLTIDSEVDSLMGKPLLFE